MEIRIDWPWPWENNLIKIVTKAVGLPRRDSSSSRFRLFSTNSCEEQQLTYYVLQEVTSFEQWKLERELTLLNVDPEVLWRPFSSLSGGEKTKVLLGLLFEENAFPLLTSQQIT